MKVHVVSDDRGRIISLSILGDVRGVSGIAKAGVLGKAGQSTHILDLPAEFEKRPLLELHRALRIDGSGDKARFVRLDHFTEPYLKGQ
jgi:hypothetical protein